jgi:ABC-type bacteriocin/lantibiotic exporter with double-glycine peptidase domain
MHMPDEGELLYDGTPAHLLDFRAFRSKCGVVLQEPFLFSGSIRENIAFNNPAASLDEVMNAARLACIHDEIMHMPMGYETHLAEDGTGLSGGQKQRVAIARALAHAPSILLLDEATSHLDAVTEQEVDRNLGTQSCTRIVIAHRLSTVRNADLILVLDKGTIVERGSHHELLKMRGLYSELVRNQSGSTESNTLEGMPLPPSLATND